MILGLEASVMVLKQSLEFKLKIFKATHMPPVTIQRTAQGSAAMVRVHQCTHVAIIGIAKRAQYLCGSQRQNWSKLSRTRSWIHNTSRYIQVSLSHFVSYNACWLPQIKEWRARTEENGDCPQPHLKRKRMESDGGRVSVPYLWFGIGSFCIQTPRKFGWNRTNAQTASAPASPTKYRRLGIASEATGQVVASGSVEAQILISALSTIERAIDRNTEMLSKICLALENGTKSGV